MTADKKTSAKIPVIIAASCLVIILVIGMAFLAGGGGAGGSYPAAAACACPPVTTAEIPAGPALLSAPCPAFSITADSAPVVPEPLASADLVLTLPPPGDRIPYTARDFDPAARAVIAWWMSPGFMDNTSEFRSYERTTDDGRQEYPPEHRIFFSFIQDELDAAESQSVLSTDRILFRGIGPSFAGTVMNTSRYHEQSFASTSYDISLPLDAFGTRGADGYRTVMVLKRRAGEHALYISEDQREYLLPRGTEWTVARTVDVENLTVTADFPLHDRTAGTASFDHVRLIYLRPAGCLWTTVAVPG